MTSLIHPIQSTALVLYAQPEPLLEKVKSHMQSIVGRSLEIQKADHRYFHKHGMGGIVILVGNSTSGKTSIIKALKKREPNWVEDGHDLRSNALVLKLFRKHCPSEVATLEILMEPLDIRTAIYRKEYVWKKPISLAEQLEAEKALQQIEKIMDSIPLQEKDSLFENMQLEMVDEALEHSRRGENTIFDVIDIDAVARHLIEKNFDGPLTIALVYCPFRELSARMERRNKEAEACGDLGNQAIGTYPLEQFSDIYTQRKQGQLALESISRSQATRAFCDNFDKKVFANRRAGLTVPSDDQLLVDKANDLQKFLARLGFTDDINTIEIVPRNQDLYHLFIDSSKLAPDESADILHKSTRGFRLQERY